LARFYKFRGIGDPSNLEKDFSLDALFKSYAVFSGRKNFNDPFDSKIDLVRPTPQEVLCLLRHPGVITPKRNLYEGWLSGEQFSGPGLEYLTKFDEELVKLIDNFPIYSLSSHNCCILLWAHYASCHTGFCIEFEYGGEQPTQVRYQSQIDSIRLLDLLEYNNLGIDPDNKLAEQIRNALYVKLDCWSYEGEYRLILASEDVLEHQQFRMERKYDPEQVKAIIFGCRMSSRVKDYILSNIPFSTKFKQAVEMRDSVEIVDFDKNRHL
jgi:Protein of unknown function (DUF2971)